MAKSEARGITTPSYRALERPVGAPSSARKFDWYIDTSSLCCVYSIFFSLLTLTQETRERDESVRFLRQVDWPNASCDANYWRQSSVRTTASRKHYVGEWYPGRQPAGNVTFGSCPRYVPRLVRAVAGPGLRGGGNGRSGPMAGLVAPAVLRWPWRFRRRRCGGSSARSPLILCRAMPGVRLRGS
jgi:hypothetical protein